MIHFSLGVLGVFFSMGLLMGCEQAEPSIVESPVDDTTESSVDDTPGPVCSTDADCLDPSLSYCSATLGCVGCLNDDQCGPGRRCDEGSCDLFDSCESSRDCGDDRYPACNSISKECRECVGDSDCRDSSRCHEGKCEEVIFCKNSLDCPLGSVCNDEANCVECADDDDCEGDKLCDGFRCVAGCSSDKDCVGSGRLCDKQSGHCADCFESSDCPDAYYCEANRCLIDRCVNDARQCSEEGLGVDFCSEDGSSVKWEACRSQTTCIEEDGEVSCKDWLCEPGSVKCNSDQEIVGCDKRGLQTMVIVDCAAEEGICEGTSCVEVVCDAELKFCRGATLMQCSPNGASFAALETCDTKTHFCDDVTGQCRLHNCDLGKTTCDGDVLRTCKADGSDFDEGVPCAENQACFAGACKARLCDVDKMVCVGKNVFECIQNGTKSQFLEACGPAEACGPSGCFALACEPNAAVCDGSVTGVCKADGSGIEVDSSSLDCAESGRICVSGTCLDVICNPDEPMCDENRATHCNSTGTGYADGGIDCVALGESCEDGVCFDKD